MGHNPAENAHLIFDFCMFTTAMSKVWPELLPANNPFSSVKFSPRLKPNKFSILVIPQRRSYEKL